MDFVVQSNLLAEENLKKMADAVRKYPHQTVDIIPFSDQPFDREIDGTDHIPYGSTSMIMEAYKRGWQGCHYSIDMMTYREYMNNPNMLNGDMILTVQDAIEFLKKQPPKSLWFVKPANDLKQFTGTVLQASEIWVWLESMTLAIGGGSYYMSPDAYVVIDHPVDISAEWRWFIINGKIVTGSLYKAHNQLRPIREDDQKVIDEAQKLADVWLPLDCVVMDTCLVGDQVKIVEFNALNASGFYASDHEKVFDALWTYHQK